MSGGEDGNAPVEFVGWTLLMVVPLLYLLVALARIQAASFAVASAARQFPAKTLRWIAKSSDKIDSLFVVNCHNHARVVRFHVTIYSQIAREVACLVFADGNPWVLVHNLAANLSF